MVLTFLLGLTFLLTQVIEYHRIGFNTSDTSFAAPRSSGSPACTARMCSSA